MGVMPNAMRTECARWEWDELGVEGTEMEVRGNEVDPDGVGGPGISGGSGGWEEGENAVWTDGGVVSGDPARLRLCVGECNVMSLERLGGGGKLSGGLLVGSPDTIVSTAEAHVEAESK